MAVVKKLNRAPLEMQRYCSPVKSLVFDFYFESTYCSMTEI